GLDQCFAMLDSALSEAQAVKQFRFACRVGVCMTSERSDSKRALACNNARRNRPEIGELPAASARGIEQRNGVSLSRLRKDLRRWTLFHAWAVLHDGNV